MIMLNRPQSLITDQFMEQNLVYRFMGPVMTAAQTLARELRVFRYQRLLLLCRSDFTFYAPLPEAMLDRCAPHMRYDTSKPAQQSLQCFPLRIYVSSQSHYLPRMAANKLQPKKHMITVYRQRITGNERFVGQMNSFKFF